MATPKQSAGILLFRLRSGQPEVLLAHPGGPFWAKKDLGAWSIPKGEFELDEEPLTAAIREFEEETGTRLKGNFTPLQPIKQKSGKIIHIWFLEGDLDITTITSNTFEMEWPPHSGKMQQIPEIDRAEWFSIKKAKEKIVPGQSGFIDEFLSICPALNSGSEFDPLR